MEARDKEHFNVIFQSTLILYKWIILVKTKIQNLEVTISYAT